MAYSFGDYRKFLQSFIKADYAFVSFSKQEYGNRQVILRHDIDFDTGLALEAAKIEAELGIRATYFFLTRYKLYNLFDPEHYENVKEIQALGHKVSIHFDPTIYEDFHKGLGDEIIFFYQLFKVNPAIISLHRPNKFFLEFDEPIGNIEHTYQSKYFKNIKYFADSMGLWRFGNPLDSDEFKNGKPLHLLIHPIWWMEDGTDSIEKLKNNFHRHGQELKTFVAKYSVPFRENIDKF